MHGADPAGIPRIAPIPKEGWTPQIRAFFAIVERPRRLEEGTRFNAQAIMANHPELCSAWAHYNKFLVRDGDLPANIRELAILRTAWNMQAGYEWYQHRIIERRVSLSEVQLEAVKGNADARLWSEAERLTLCCADEMVRNKVASADVIEGLRQHFGERQLLELLWVIGSYGMLGWIFNSLAIPIEDFCIS